jgi:methionyl-tRNA formyltransferase
VIPAAGVLAAEAARIEDPGDVAARAAHPGGPDTRPVPTIFLGSGSFAVPILEALVASPETEIVAIISAPDRPVGRKAVPTAVPVASRARELGLPLVQPDRIRDPAAVASLAALRPAFGVLADYGQIVPTAVLDLPPRGILNVHPSLLPRHRGATPIPAAILAGDRETGVSLIRMDEGLDTGPIVAVHRWPLDGTETAPELEARAAAAGSALVAATLGPWLRSELIARPQPVEGATLTRPFQREDGRLDPDRPAAELERQVRALQPWPGTFVDTDAGRIKVLRASVAPVIGTSSAAQPGTFGPGPGLRLQTIDGDLVLALVQPAGGRVMTGAELVLGRPGLPGSRVARRP